MSSIEDFFIEKKMKTQDRKNLLVGFYIGMILTYVFLQTLIFTFGDLAYIILVASVGVIVAVVRLLKLHEESIFLRGLVSGSSLVAGMMGIPMYKIVITKTTIFIEPAGIFAYIKSPYILIILSILLFFYSATILGWAFGPIEFSLLIGIFVYIGLFFIVLTHELGHALFAFLYFKEIVIALPFGGYTVITLYDANGLLFSVLGGPFVTWLEGLILYYFKKTRVFGLLILNLLIANLVPIPYNDGFWIIFLSSYSQLYIAILSLFVYLVMLISSLYLMFTYQ